jgi:hypothetical protein
MPESAPPQPEPVEIDLRDDVVDLPTAPMPTVEIEAALPAAVMPGSAPAPTTPAPHDPPSAADLIAGLVRDTRLAPTPTPSAPAPPPRAQPGPPTPLTRQPPPPPAYNLPPAADALPYPAPGSERSPLILIGLGVGLGLVLLVLGVLGVQLLGGRDDAGTATAATRTPSAVSAGIISATASSTQNPEGGITYSAENTLDGRPETAWNSDGRTNGKGPGMVLTYRFADPVDLASVTILNGYQKTTQSAGKPATDLFTQNGRVRGLRVTTDTGSWTWELADDRAPQSLAKAFGRTSSVRFEVLSVYSGSKYLDLAVSEVSFGAVG